MALYSCSCSVGYTWDLFLHYSGTVSIVAPFFSLGNDLDRRFPLRLQPKASRISIDEFAVGVAGFEA